MDIRKNLLDLEYQKYLQFYTTSIIILFTYIIGIGIALLTNQININDYNQLAVLIIMSSTIVGISLASLLIFNINLKRINEEVKKLA